MSLLHYWSVYSIFVAAAVKGVAIIFKVSKLHLPIFFMRVHLCYVEEIYTYLCVVVGALERYIILI